MPQGERHSYLLGINVINSVEKVRQMFYELIHPVKKLGNCFINLGNIILSIYPICGQVRQVFYTFVEIVLSSNKTTILNEG